MDLYAEQILEHFKNPRNKGGLNDPTVEHKEVNLSCGDVLTLHLKIEGDTIKELKWSGTGCAISLGAMSMFSEKLAGMTVEEATNLSAKDIEEMLKVPISKRREKCALLCLHALKNAMRKFKGEKEQSWSETIGQGEMKNE